MILQRQYDAAGAITARRVVKFDTTDTTIAQASSVSDRLIGISLGPDDATVADPVDVCMLGECMLDVAGAVGRGALLTVDSDGKGVQANPSAGVNNRIVAMALQTGTNTTIRVLVLPGMLQGA